MIAPSLLSALFVIAPPASQPAAPPAPKFDGDPAAAIKRLQDENMLLRAELARRKIPDPTTPKGDDAIAQTRMRLLNLRAALDREVRATITAEIERLRAARAEYEEKSFRLAGEIDVLKSRLGRVADELESMQAAQRDRIEQNGVLSLNNLGVGDSGEFADTLYVTQVTGSDSMLVAYQIGHVEPVIFRIANYSTAGITDRSWVKPKGRFVCINTDTYKTKDGGSNTVFVVAYTKDDEEFALAKESAAKNKRQQ